jgi:predicted DNA-binding transcriptional regulator YafY
MQLRISRITSAKVLGRPVIFLREADVKRAAEHQIGGWVNSDEPFQVSIRVKGASWIKAMEEARPDFPGFTLERTGTSAIIRFMANAPEGLIRWILQLGPSAEVLTPAFLRQKVREDIEAMAKQYQ